MPCINCQKIRAAILHGRMAEAAGLTVEVLREKVGLAAPDREPEEQQDNGIAVAIPYAAEDHGDT